MVVEVQPSADRGNSSPVRVSVIIPVFNAMPYLVTLMDSLVAQDLPDDAYEIIAVNDGSTDGSPATLDGYAASCTNVRVFHQDNSGWPGQPRNAGFNAARGRYVFFADADDVLGVEALRRMADFADEHDSDLVVPKMVGLGGRVVAPDVYVKTAIDADLEVVLTTLSPQKLFRRSMLLDADIRFPEGKIRLEDGMMLARAYFTARRVSILADYDYYFLRAREDGNNISAGALDPAGYTWSIGEVARLIRANDPDPDRADAIVLDLYRRKCLKMYEPERFARMSGARRDAWMAQHQGLMADHIPVELESHLNYPFKQRSELLRANDKPGLLTLGKVERGSVFARVVSARWTLTSLVLELQLERRQPPHGQSDLFLQLHDRDSESRVEIPMTDRDHSHDDPHDRSALWSEVLTISSSTVRVPRKLLKRTSAVLIDVYVRGESELGTKPTRVLVPEGSKVPPARRSVKPYGTNAGNFSIRVGRSKLPMRPAPQSGSVIATERLAAETTALSEAVTMLACIPTPQTVSPATSHSTYAAASESPPVDSACSE